MLTLVCHFGALEAGVLLVGALSVLVRVRNDLLRCFFIVKELLFVTGMGGRSSHHAGVAFCSLFDVLKVRVPTVFRKPFNDVDALLPMQCEAVALFIVDMVLAKKREKAFSTERCLVLMKK